MSPIMRAAPACTHLSMNDPQQKVADDMGGVLDGEEIRNGLRRREKDKREKSNVARISQPLTSEEKSEK